MNRKENVSNFIVCATTNPNESLSLEKEQHNLRFFVFFDALHSTLLLSVKHNKRNWFLKIS